MMNRNFDSVPPRLLDDGAEAETRVSRVVSYDPVRPNPLDDGNTNTGAKASILRMLDGKDTELVLALCAGVAGEPDLGAAAGRIAAWLVRFETGVARIAIFSAAGDSIEPLASATRPGVDPAFAISKDLLRRALRERRPQLTTRDNVKGPARQLAAIAIGGNAARPIAVHIEMEDDAGGDQSVAAAVFGARVARVEAILRLVEPKLEALDLRTGLERWMLATAMMINAAIEAKDTYTAGHSERVARYSVAVAQVLGLREPQREIVRFSAICHDIGKIGVPDAILKKPGLLSNEEFDEMKAHPGIGAIIITHAPNAKEILAGVRSHHEKWDGTGYPDALVGEKIPLVARIICVTDAFDAMTSGRTYSGYMSQDEAVESLSKKVDLFDPEVLRALVTAYDRELLTMRTGTSLNARPA